MRSYPSLAETIRKVLDLNEEQRASFAERAIKHIRDNYSKDNMGARTLDVYSGVLVNETDRRETVRQ